MSPSRKIVEPLRAYWKRRSPLACVACFALLVPLIITFAGTPAVAATPLPRLVVARDSNAADCPDATELALAVERQMQRPALDPTHDERTGPVYAVHIEHSADGYAATIQSGDLTRDLADPGLTCAELGDALALTLAILLDNEPSPPPPPPPSPTPSPKPPVSVPPTQKPMTVRRENPIRQWNFGIYGGIAETIGFLTPFSFAMMGDVWVRYRAASFGAGVFAIPWPTENNTKATAVTMQLITGTFNGCGMLAGKPSGLNFSLCGQSLLGVVHGEGRGYTINRAGTRPWFALGGMGSLEGQFFAGLGWSIRLTVAVPVITQRFTARRIEGAGPDALDTITTLFEPSKLAGFLGAGLRWTIF